jgi:hypothetical protein
MALGLSIESHQVDLADQTLGFSQLIPRLGCLRPPVLPRDAKGRGRAVPALSGPFEIISTTILRHGNSIGSASVELR